MAFMWRIDYLTCLTTAVCMVLVMYSLDVLYVVVFDYRIYCCQQVLQFYLIVSKVNSDCTESTNVADTLTLGF